MRPLLPSDALVTRALVELDRRLPDHTPPMHLRVVGGYALQVLGARTDPNEATDIDYLGTPLPPEVKALVDEVGLQYGLGPAWMNNDVTLSGNKDLSSIELATGPLTFTPADTPQLRHFTVEVADHASLLRMKLIALDTQLAVFADSHDMTDITRVKDLQDIRLITNAMNITSHDLNQVVSQMDAGGYLLEPIATAQAARRAHRGDPDTDIYNEISRNLQTQVAAIRTNGETAHYFDSWERRGNSPEWLQQQAITPAPEHSPPPAPPPLKPPASTGGISI